MADLYRVDENGKCEKSVVLPAQADGKFTLAELQGYAGGYVEVLAMIDRVFVVDEDARMKGSAYNTLAAEQTHMALYGNVLVCTPQEAAIMVFPDEDEGAFYLYDTSVNELPEELEFTDLTDAKHAARNQAWNKRQTVCVVNGNTEETVYIAHFVTIVNGYAKVLDGEELEGEIDALNLNDPRFPAHDLLGDDQALDSDWYDTDKPEF